MKEKNKIDNLAFHFPYIENTCLSWKEVLHLATPINIKKNQNLVDVGDNNINFYYIEEGLFQLKYYSSHGKSRGINCFGKGSLLCLASAYLQLDNASSDVYCIRNAKAWKFSGKLLSDLEFSKKYPLLINEALKQVSTNLLINITYSTNMLVEPVYERTIYYLLALDKERGSSSTFPKFTQQEMAEMLNMHRVTFVNILQRLKKEGLINIDKEIKIIRKEELMKKIIL